MHISIQILQKKKKVKENSSVYSRYIDKYKYFGVFSVFTWIDCQLMKTPQVLVSGCHDVFATVTEADYLPKHFRLVGFGFFKLE